MIELDLKREKELKDKIRSTLRAAYNLVDDKSVDIYVEKWKKNKEGIYKFLSKQKGWNEKELCVVVKDQVFRQGNVSGAIKIFRSILETAFSEIHYSDFQYIIEQILRDKAQSLALEPFYSEGIVNEWDDYKIRRILNSDYSAREVYTLLFHKCHLNVGMKKSRMLCKVLDYLGTYLNVDYRTMKYELEDETVKIRKPEGGYEITHTHTWDQLRPKLCDYLNPLTVDETFYISCSPLDYLTMSHGNRWSSCHSLRDHGCYHAATVTTLTDPSTIIIYTLPKDKTPDENFYSIDKQTRQLVFLADGLNGIFQQTFYPDKDTNDNSVVRNVLQQMLANYLVKPNLWSSADMSDIDIDTSDYLGYEDWNNGKPYSLTYIKDTQVSFKIGEDAPCVDDSSLNVYDNETIGSGDYVICENCGEHLCEDEAICIDGCYYCEACVDELFIRCERCGDYFMDEDLIYIDDEPYCEHCAKKLDWQSTEDGYNTTNYVTLFENGNKLYFKYEEALQEYNSDAKYCEEHNVWFVDTCPECEKAEILKRKIAKIEVIIDELKPESEWYQYKDSFKEEIKKDLSNDIVELILKGEF